MAVRLIKKSWWIDFRFNYQRYRKRSPENSRAGAQAYETVLRQKLARGEDVDFHPKTELLFEQFVWQWFDDYVVANNKYSEQTTKRYIISASLVPFFGKTPLLQITPQQIERYKAQQMSLGVSKKTVNNRLAVLSKCLTTAHEWQKIDDAPPKIKRLKCPPAKTDHLSPEESVSLIAHASGVMFEMILTTLRTGMREGEIKGLQWEAIDWQNHTLVVRHSWCDHRKVLEAPKSNRERHIPLDDQLYRILETRRRASGHIFLDEYGKTWTHRKLSIRLTSVCNRAGIRRITWHTMRHTFATHLAMRGVPLNVVQTLLGHSTISTTMRYAHVAPSSLRTAIGMLDTQDSLSSFGQPVVNQWQELWRRDLGTEATRQNMQ